MLNVKLLAATADYEDAFGLTDPALIRLATDGEGMQLVAADIILQMLDTLETDIASPQIYACLTGLPPDIAATGSNLLIAANSTDDGELSELADATILCLVALIHASGQQATALDMLQQARVERPTPTFSTAAYLMRCWILAIDGSIASHWSASVEHAPDMIDQARRDLEDRPLDLSAYHRLARGLAEAGQVDKALAAFMTGLALPVGQSEKLDLGTDFAIFAAYLRCCGQDDLLDSPRIRFALNACPKVTAHAESMLIKLEAEGALAAIGQGALADIRCYLRDFAWRQGESADRRSARVPPRLRIVA